MAVMTSTSGWGRAYVTNDEDKVMHDAKAKRVLHVPGSQPNRMCLLKTIKTWCIKQWGLKQ